MPTPEELKRQQAIHKVYSALQTEGFTGIGTDENDFASKMSDESKRRKVYDALKSSGYSGIGDTFEDFSGKIYAAPVVEDQTQRARMEPPVEETPVQKDSVRQPNVQQPQAQSQSEEDVTLNFDDEPNGIPQRETIRGFFPAVAQGAKNMYYGLVNLLGEAVQPFDLRPDALGHFHIGIRRNVFDPLSWGSRNAQEALDELDRRRAEGLGANERYLDPEYKEYEAKILADPNLTDKEKKDYLRKHNVGMAAYEEYAKSVREQAGSYDKAQDRLRHNADIDLMIAEALKRANGNPDEARRILEEKANDKSIGDKMMDYASEGLAQAKETKGFGAWLGQQIPMLLPSVAAIGLSAVTKNPKYAEWIGKGSFGVMAASSAGEAMNQAREYGATDNEVWAAGFTDAAIMYAAGKIPFNRYTGRLFNGAKKQAAAELSAALADESSLAAKEAEELFKRAAKDLGGSFNWKEYLADIGAHGLTMGSMSALQSMVPMIYEHPEDYPALTEILEHSLAGFRDGVFLGATLGAATQGMKIRNNRARWKEQGGIVFAEMEADGGEPVMAEVIGIDGKAIQRPKQWWNPIEDEFVKVNRSEKSPLAGEGDVEMFDAGDGGTVQILVDGKLESISKAEFRKRVRSMGRKSFKQVEEAEVQSQMDNAYEEGYNVNEPGERHDAQNMYERQRKLLQDKTGLSDVSEDDVMMYYESENWTPEQKEAVLDYLKAKAARTGMFDSIRDDIKRKMVAATTAIDNNTSKTDGLVHPATMKDDRRAYVVDGTVVMTEDGTMVDHAKSMHDLLMRDAETGELFFASIDQILSVDEAIDPLAEKKTVAEQIRQSIAQQAADEIDGKITLDAEQTYSILDAESGAFIDVKIVPYQDQKTGAVSLVDPNTGLLTITTEDGQTMQIDEQALRVSVEAANIKRLDNYIARLDELRAQYDKPDGDVPAAANAPQSPTGEVINNDNSAPVEEPEQPIIPTDDKGRKQYMQAPKEATYEDIYSDESFETDDEAYGFISGKVKRSEAALKKSQAEVDKIKPENFDTPTEYRAAKDAAMQAHKPFQDTYDYWKSVQDLADADIAAAKAREERAARLEEQELQEPKTLEELAANGFRGALHSLDKADFKKETGLSETELKKFFPFWAKKGQGLTMQGLAEQIAMDEDQTGLVPQDQNADQPDTQAVRNAILEIFRTATRPTDIYEYTRNANLQRKAQMQREMEAAEEQARLEAEAAAAAEAEAATPVEEPAVAETPEDIPEVPESATPVQQAIAEEAAKVNPEPTDAQKEAGNYQKGHVKVDGYDITIETAKGTVRRGTDADGKPWESEMHQNYGYIRRTEGTDGDHIDVFLSDNPEQGNVFVVDQINPKTGAFDEHKVMYGFGSLEEARAAYLSNYEEGWQGLGNITEVSKEEFKKWIDSSHRKTKPFAEYKSVKPVEQDTEKKPAINFVFNESPKPEGINSNQRHRIFDDGITAYIAASRKQLAENPTELMGYDQFAAAYRERLGEELFAKDEPYLRAFFDYFESKTRPAVAAELERLSQKPAIAKPEEPTEPAAAPETEIPVPATKEEAHTALNNVLAAPNGKGLILPEAIYVNEAIREMDPTARTLMNAETTKGTRDGILPHVKNYIDKLAEDYGKRLEQFGSPEGVVKYANDKFAELKKKVDADEILPEEFEAQVKDAVDAVGMLIRKMRYDKPSTVEGRNYDWEHLDKSGFRSEVGELLEGLSPDVLAQLEAQKDLPLTVQGLIRTTREAAQYKAQAEENRKMYFASHPEMPSAEPKGKFDIWKFTSKEKQRPAMTGVFHDKGFKVASDTHILVAVKDAYPKENEGKIIDKKKNVITEAKYPKWRDLIQKGEDAGVDVAHLASFVEGVKGLEGNNFKDAKIVVPIGGTYRAFGAEALDHFLRAAREVEGKLSFRPAGESGKSIMLHADGKKGHAIIMNSVPSNWTSPMFHWYATPAELEQLAKQREQVRTVAEATSLVTGKPVEEILEEKKPAPVLSAQEKWDAAEAALAKAVTGDDRVAAIKMRKEALLDELRKIDEEAAVVTYDDVLDELKQDDIPADIIEEVREGLELDNPNRDTNRAFFIPYEGRGIYIIADDITSLEDGVSAFVHERQHAITLQDKLADKLTALPGFDRTQIWKAMRSWDGGFWYQNKDDVTLADEFISMAMEKAYKCETPEVFEQQLRKAGIENEEIITFVKNLDNEQRNSESLSSARRVTLFQESEQGSGSQDAGNPTELTGGNLGEEGDRPAQSSEASPARRSRSQVSKDKSGPSRQIEDFGEKIAGARKDELRNLAKTLEDATEESFVALPLGKAFKRPNTKKLIENGVISPEDAALVDAVSWLITGSPKPVKLKDRSYKARRRDAEIVDWAKQQSQRAKVLLDYLNADAEGKKDIIASLADVPRDVKEAADAHREYVKQLNRDWKEVKVGDLYPLNPIYVAYRLFQSTGYNPEENGRIKFPTITCDDMGRTYTVKSGSYGYEYARSVEDALKQATYLVQLQMGVEDLDHPSSAFRVVGIRDKKVGSGRYRVNYWKGKGRGLPSYETAEFDSKKEALEFARKKYPDTSDEELLSKGGVEEIQKWADPTTFKIKAKNAATGDEFEMAGTYGSIEEAREAIDSKHEELNAALNEEIRKKLDEKGEAPAKREKLYIAYYYEGGGRGGSYGVWAKDKGFWLGNQLLQGGFRTSKEAREFLEAHRAEYEGQLKEMAKRRSEFVYFDGDAKGRKGKDYRKGKDVGEDEYKVFGFRGVQFGNWANDKDRQAALNNAYDSFMNLAELLGVSPAALSLNGELGLAFGARGSGSANAHYESDQVVINLTKTRGAGSLAHEWWHALDNYFARHGGIAHGFISATQIAGVRPEVQQAFNALTRAIRQSDYGKRSVQKGDYWGSDWEMTARLFAEWVDRKIAANGESDHFLVRGVDDETAERWKEISYRFYEMRMKVRQEDHPELKEEILSYEEFCKTPEALAGFPYPTTEEINTTFGPLMQDVFDTIQEKTEDGKQVLFSKVYHGSAAQFDQFDLQFLGSGEGNYVYGPGIYVTEVDGIAKSYADVAVGNRLAEVRDGIARQQERLQEILAGYPAKIAHHEEMAKQFAGTWGGETHKKFADYYRQMLETGEYTWDPEAKQVSDNIKWRTEQLNVEGKRHLYTVEIPDDTGHNYLTYGEDVPMEDTQRIKSALRARLLSDPNSGYTADIADILDDELDAAFTRIGGETILGTLDAYLGNDGVGLKSTKFLRELGYVGIKVDTNYQDPNGDHSANNYVIFDPKDAKITENVRYSKQSRWPSEDREQAHVRFSKVRDKKVLDELEKGQTEVGFRNVVLNEDGSLGSPMANKLGRKGQKSAATTPFSFDEWEMSDEHPELATEDGKINLIKPDGLGNVDAVDYNPYIHIRPSLLNKQFTSAWKRDNLVYVETLYPTSELTSGYQAEKAKKAVGRHDWNGGELVLSRYDKPVRIVPWEEVADTWEAEYKDRGVTFDIVPPRLLPVLVERGIEILPPKSAAGAPAMAAYNRWANGGSRVRFSKMYHGSGADFDAFDLSHVGEGEGAQAHGYGHYVTESESTAGRYANSFAKSDPLHDQIVEARRKNSERKQEILNAALWDKEPAAMAEWERLNADDERLTNLLRMANNPVRPKDLSMDMTRDEAALYEAASKYISTYGFENAQAFKDLGSYNYARDEEKAAIDLVANSSKDDWVFARNMYHVEIPDDTGENYIDEMKTLAKPLRRKIADVVRQIPESKLDRYFHGPNWLPQGFQTLANVIEREQFAGLEIRQRLEDALGNTHQARKETSEILHKAGFVGMKYDGRVDGPCAVIFDDADIKVREHVRFSKTNTNERVFISNAEQAAGRIKMEKATPQQWIAMLEKEGGLKAGEDKWIGLSDWLRSSDKKTLTKQEVLDYIKQNEIVIEEDHYSQNANLDENEKMLDLREEFYELMEEGEEETGSIYTSDHADWALEQMISRYGDDFGQGFEWVFDENRYPKLDAIYDSYEDSISDAARYYLEINDKPIYSTRLDYTTEGLSNKQEIALTVPTIAPWNESDKIHFGDAGEGRAVAWIRFGEANYGLNKRALVIDEIQSKRHQEGREQGYKNPRLEEVSERMGYLSRVRNGMMHDKTGEKIPFTTEMKEELQRLTEERNELMGMEYHVTPADITLTEDKNLYYTEYDGHEYKVGKGTVSFSEDEAKEYLAGAINSGISRRNNARIDHERQKPRPAPFEKNWHELAFKRMLRFAADEGYDMVAWTTGNQQADRYDMGSVLNHIEAGRWTTDEDASDGRRYGEESKALTLYTESGEISLDINRQGTVLSSDMEEMNGKSLHEVLGKELAVKIISEEGVGEYSGESLRVGGEGMKGFYDDILPRFVNKYGKKWGVKVEDVTLYDLGDGPLTMHSVKVTPEMKEAVKHGQVMFSKVRKEPIVDIDAFSEVRQGGIEDLAARISSDKGTMNIKTQGLSSQEIKDLYSRVVKESNGTAEELRKRAEEIQSLSPISIEKGSMTRKEFADEVKDKLFKTEDGINVGFSGTSIGKLNVPALREAGVLGAIERLLESAKFAYSQSDFEDQTGEHKTRQNVIEYRNYVAKFDNGEEYYCRFTIERFTDGRLVSHGANISDVEIMKKSLQDSLTALAERQASGANGETSDAKLLNFFVFASTGKQISKEKEYELPIKGAKVHWSKLSRPVEDIVNDGKQKVAEENDEARAQLNTRMRAIDKNLAKLRQAASAQREYDRETVRSITDLAKELLKEGALSDPTRQEIEKMLTVTRWATGRMDLDAAVDAIMDLMVGNQLRHAKGVFDGLLKIRGSKVDAKGVEVQGKLDVPGQRTMQVFKDAMDMSPDAIEDHIAAAQERLDSPDDAVKASAGDELVGLELAKAYVEDVRASIDEEKGIKNELKQAAEDRRAGRMAPASYREFVRSCEEALRQNNIERIEAYNTIVGKLSGMLYDSIARGTAFRESEKERVERIHHFANSDLTGTKSDEHGNKNDRFANNGFLRFFLKPLATFDQMLRHFGSKSVNGEGYLWNHFMRGWVDANDAEFKGLQAATKTLDDKVSDVFGRKMRWSDLYSVERDMPTVDVKFWDGGKMQDHKLTQGNLLYIYMVNKMSDGRMKLRRMGIEQEHVDAIKAQMDPRFIELADWLQEDFLVNIRNKYNRVHEQMFGASMAAIENYFPLKILANARVREVDMSTPDMDGTTPATITGSIIKRRRNGLALDVLGTDAFSVVIEHLQQMEHWAAFAPFNRDLNTLLSYKTFRNRVQNMSGIYGAGSVIWENFRKSAEIAAGVYHPAVTKDSIDSTAVNIAKGVTAAKISFRVYTAIKQLLSMPAFVSDAGVVELGKSIGTPWKSWNWAMENLPTFEKRWKSRQAGDTRLMQTDSDWKLWRNNIVQTASRLGMSPNAFVDALTVSIGAKAMYETKKAKYIKDGYTEEQADKRAKQDATVLFNETQQSNENAFLSAMQLDRTWASVALTVFRNSSMGYQRQLVDAVRNLGHKMQKGYKEQAIEFMAKQMVRDGVNEEEARGAAERNYKRSTFHDALKVALFGFVMQFAWNLGAYLPYLIAGDDDDEKKKMLQDAARHGLVGGMVEGLSGGSIVSEAANMLASGEGVQNYSPSLMPVASDIQKIIKMMSYDQVAAANEILNLLVQAGVGVNPQTLTDIGVAIYDACNGDLETSKEATLAIMRILQVPQSQTDKVFMDEIDFTAEKGLDLQIGEFAKRYADYKVKRGAPLTGWAYSDELKEKRVNTYSKRFTKDAQELIRTRGNDVDRAYYEYVDTEHKEVDATLRDLRSGQKAAAQSGDQMGAMEYAQMMSDFMQTPEFQRYARVHGNVLAIKRLQTALKNADDRTRDALEDQMLQLKHQMVEELGKDNK